jgi:DNA invertase Pin-like site-specific DNA recombinase
MSHQPKVAIYARCSTGEQSLEPQLRDLREYVRNRGWEQIAEYCDFAESGKNDARPAWNELLTKVRQRKVNVIAIAAIDRIGRSLPSLVKALALIVDCDVTLISLRESFDLSTAQGRMLAGLFSVLADYELSLIKERTKAGMRAARAKGKQIGPKKNHLCHHKATELLDRGLGQIKVAKALGVGVGRINQFVHEVYVPAKQRQQLAASVATMDKSDE